jgi:tetratricopeptide (TPR) repeat protein
VIAFIESALREHPRDAWLEHYLGFAHFRASNVADGMGDEQKSRMHLDQAERALERSLAERQIAESHAVLSAAIGQRIHGVISGMRLGPRAEKALARALELAPRNPRVWVIRAGAALYRPRLFGGSAQRAEEYARTAISLLTGDTVAAPGPRWGEGDAYTFLGLALAAQGKYADARAAYEHVIIIEPGNRYVRRLRDSTRR